MLGRSILLGLFPALLGAQTAMTASFAKTSVFDSPYHIDLTPGTAISLTTRLSSYTSDQRHIVTHTLINPVWQSADTTIAVVKNDQVFGKRPGVTKITTTREGTPLSIRVCVSPKEVYELSPRPVGGAVRLTNSLSYMDSELRFVAVDTIAPLAPIDWSGCVHYYLAALLGAGVPDPSEMNIGPDGVLHFNHTLKKYYVGAAVGTTWPHGYEKPVPLHPKGQ